MPGQTLSDSIKARYVFPVNLPLNRSSVHAAPIQGLPQRRRCQSRILLECSLNARVSLHCSKVPSTCLHARQRQKRKHGVERQHQPQDGRHRDSTQIPDAHALYIGPGAVPAAPTWAFNQAWVPQKRRGLHCTRPLLAEIGKAEHDVLLDALHPNGHPHPSHCVHGRRVPPILQLAHWCCAGGTEGGTSGKFDCTGSSARVRPR